MSKYKTLVYSRLALLAVIILSLAVLIANHAQTSWNIFLAVLGFSAVVFIHECGHFFVAKAGGIKVEAFSVFIPPLLVGVRRTEEGFRVRILPGLFPKPDDPEGNGLLCFTFGPKGKEGDTEYRIGLIPVAGYVKMLGQDDTGADKQSADPRSFNNKPISVRMAVIVAGVTFNLITAVILLMVLVAVLGMFGVEATSLVAILGASTLAIGLALQGTLSDLAAGFMLILFRPEGNQKTRPPSRPYSSWKESNACRRSPS